ncbi:MAG: hypothetical protein IIZ18_02660 [Ruminococcus sp.]|nr:hypothetical protein [Ruminococcus sp.]
MSEKKIKNTGGMTIRKKFLLAAGIWLSGFLLMVISSAWYTSLTRSECERKNEQTAIYASQQLLEMAIGSGVSIARNIYANPNMYTFLDKEYESSAEYYDDYYAMLQNSPTAVAESNAVKRYTVYTSNPTILPGGNIAQLSSAVNSEWLTTYNRLGRAMVMYCNSANGEVSLIRRLDLQELTHGDAYLKIDLNLTQLKSCIDSIDFDGDIFIVSGASIIYSSTPGAKMEDISITHDFCALTKNYYTTDVEFYSLSSDMALLSGFTRVIPIFAVGFAFGIALIIFLWSISSSIRRRSFIAQQLADNDGTLISLRGKNYGSDEISDLIDIGVSLSERLIRRSDEVARSSESLMEKSGDYSALFGVAMRMDAQLFVQNNYPELNIRYQDENTIKEELDLLEKFVSGKGIELVLPENVPDNKIPGMALALAAEALCGYSGRKKINIRVVSGVLTMRYNCSKPIAKTTLLRLNAIFEDSRISEEYDFSKGSRFNPFLRLKYCCGDSVSLTAISSECTDIIIKLILT